jgi:hypothetical protein
VENIGKTKWREKRKGSKKKEGKWGVGTKEKGEKNIR